MSVVNWLGVIDRTWGLAPLFTLGSPKKTSNTGLIEKNLLSLSYGAIIRKDIDSSEGLVPASYETYQIVDPGDVVLRFTDLQNDQRSLRSGLVTERGIITSAYMSLTPNLHRVLPRFLAYMMRAIDINKVFYRMGSGVRQSLNWSEFSLMRIPLPPLETQQRIADYLDRETAEIDAAVADLDRYVELLEKRRRVVIANAVTGRDQPTLKDSGSYWLGEVAIDWDVMPAWLVMRERSEKNLPDDVHLTPSQTYGVVTQKQYMEITGNKVTLNLSGADNMKRVYPGDFIIHLRSFQGGIEASTIGGKVSNAYTVLKSTSVANFDYYRWFMKSQTLIEGLASSTDQLRDGQSINFSRFSRLPLPVPPLSEQVRIADYLDRETAEIDSLITDSNHLRDLLIKRRSVLITDVVTGRKQV